MYKDRSDFTSGQGGSAWWVFNDGAGKPILFESQWTTLVRIFQQNARDNLITTPIYAFGPDGTCGAGDLIDQLSALLRSNARRRDAITVDGHFGAETADMLGALLCRTGQTGFAAQLAQAIKDKGSIPPDIVRSVILFGRHVRGVDLPSNGGAAALPPSVVALGSGIALPADTILPRWDTPPVEDSRDAGWVGQSEWGDEVPRPPSLGGGLRPWPGEPGTQNTPPPSPPGTPPAPSAPSGGGSLAPLFLLGVGALAVSAGGGRRRSSGGGSRSAPAPRRRHRKSTSTSTKAATKTRVKGHRVKRKSKPETAGEQKARLLGSRLGHLGLTATPDRLKGHGLDSHEKRVARAENKKAIVGHRRPRKGK